MKNVSLRYSIFFGVIGLLFLCRSLGFAQSGGTYVITKPVIASGEKSSGGI